MWGRWAATALGGVFVLLLVLGLLFSFAPLIFGAAVALLLAAGFFIGMIGRRVSEDAEDPRPPRSPSREAMTAERGSPSRSNKPPTAP